jgi:CRP-like cAMP-binding protein
LGEKAIFNREPRSATACSQGVSRLQTIDKRNFMRRIQEDLTIAFRLVQDLCSRIQELNEDVLMLNRTIQERMKDRIEN